MSVTALPDLNALEPDALKALIVAQHDELIATHEQLLSHRSEIEHLKLLLAKLRRMQFGRKSEKLTQQIEQLELRLEELQSKPSDSAQPAESQVPPAASSILITSPAKPARRPLPIIYGVKRRGTNRRNRLVRVAAGSCANWAKTSRRCWSTCPKVSR